MILLQKVTTDAALQNLITHIILTQKTLFSKQIIIEEVLHHKLFNHFCEREKVREVVTDTIVTLLRAKYIVIHVPSGYYRSVSY